MRHIKEKHESDLMKKKNVVGVGVGDGKVVVMVERKVPLSELAEEDVVPKSLDGVRTDVLEVGVIQAPPPFETQGVYTGRYRPPMPGVSVGHKDVTAGTFGAVVHQDHKTRILSNNHVLANSNKGKEGDAIFQPGRHDGGGWEDKIAELDEFVPIALSSGASCQVATAVCRALNWMADKLGRSHRLLPYDSAQTFNQVDAAIAKTTVPVLAGIIDGVGVPKGVVEPSLGMVVQKCGRTTGHTYGEVTQLDATVQVSYGPGGIGFFNHQIVLTGEDGEPMSAGGDSGSLVLDLEGNAVGLLFAGSKTVTIINPIDMVLEALDIEFVK